MACKLRFTFLGFHEGNTTYFALLRVTFEMNRYRYARTKKELALLIGVSRPTLDRLFRYRNPGREDNGTFDVAEWQAFADYNVCHWQRRNAQSH